MGFMAHSYHMLQLRRWLMCQCAPALDPVVLSIAAKLRRAGKGKRLVIANGANAEVNQGIAKLIKEAFSIRNQLPIDFAAVKMRKCAQLGRAKGRHA
jgi:hypothetical protein